MNIIPSFFTHDKIEPTIKKFMSDTTSNNSYFDPWDFAFSNIAIEIKTVYMDYRRKFDKPVFQCPFSKITEDLAPGKQVFFIWWYVTSSPLQVIAERDKVPSPWYYVILQRDYINKLKSEYNNYGTKWYYIMQWDEDEKEYVQRKLFYLKNNIGGQPTMTFNEYALKRYDY
jgi:hypothetical protein